MFVSSQLILFKVMNSLPLPNSNMSLSNFAHFLELEASIRLTAHLRMAQFKLRELELKINKGIFKCNKHPR